MELGAECAFVFYPKYDAEYVFWQNGRDLRTEVLTDKDGNRYFKVYTYAYGITKTVSFSVTDGETVYSGEYNVGDYYQYSKTLEDDALVRLVERLIEYSKSAEEYRRYVLANG